MLEFRKFPSIGRYNRGCTITQKLDGTNACVVVEIDSGEEDPYIIEWIEVDGVKYVVGAQSRNKLIVPGKTDNAGFAGWVARNAYQLVVYLGEGYHYGEWAGPGIQTSEGLKEKQFFLFNTKRWANIEEVSFGLLHCVPILYEGQFTEKAVNECLEDLRVNGSRLVEGFMRPEGIIVFHHATSSLFKITLLSDEVPKSLVEK